MRVGCRPLVHGVTFLRLISGSWLCLHPASWRATAGVHSATLGASASGCERGGRGDVEVDLANIFLSWILDIDLANLWNNWAPDMFQIPEWGAAGGAAAAGTGLGCLTSSGRMLADLLPATSPPTIPAAQQEQPTPGWVSPSTPTLNPGSTSLPPKLTATAPPRTPGPRIGLRVPKRTGNAPMTNTKGHIPVIRQRLLRHRRGMRRPQTSSTVAFAI